MSRHDRATQFAPYAPLTSFGKVLTDATLKGTSPDDTIPETTPSPQTWE